jgi:hypothetical protein
LRKIFKVKGLSPDFMDSDLVNVESPAVGRA